MPTNGGTNATDNSNLGPDVNQDTTGGDILEQLKSDSASSANLYKLELKMFKTVDRMDKTMTKEYKLFVQGKKNLDSIKATMMSLNKDVGNIKTVISSVDTSLRDIHTVLNKIYSDGLPGSSGRSGNASNGGSGSSSSNLLSKLESRVSLSEKDKIKAQSERDSGAISESEYQQRIQDADMNIQQANRIMDDIRQSLADVLQRYDQFDTFDDRIEQKLTDLVEAYESQNVTQEQFREELSKLRDSIDKHKDALESAEDIWKSDSSTYSFAQEAQKVKDNILNDFEKQKQDLIDRFERQIPDATGNPMTEEEFTRAMSELANGRDTALDNLSGYGGLVQGANSLVKVGGTLDKLIEKFSSGGTYDARTGTNTTASATVEAAGSIASTLVGEEVGTAIGTAIGGPVGAVVGGIIGDLVGSKIEALTSLIGDRLDYLANHSKKTRDEILRAGFDKISQDVKDMATYSIEIYEDATKNIYAAWDKNLSQITATQGYTKEALNSLQDSVAQRLQKEGYGTTIDASQYLDQLANTLNANLGGQLAEAFAAQNLILQKAVPEVDLSQSAAEFAAIYAQANRQGNSGEDTMIAAMNEIAGAAKALENVTEGNNQFLKQTGTLLTKATEVVNIAGGNADQIAGLTTQMMASEAAISSVAPQLSGFTNELVSVLMSNNDATAVALRAIMNDINTDIGVSATSFMKSFMDDTQGTLSTAFAAIQKFIDQNENEASRQEFLNAMQSIFGVEGSKLAQINFGGVADLIAQVNTNTNMAALTNAENLVRSGETTSLEEQLVANTANQLLATNTISSSIDNKLMRKLESNELNLEKIVYSVQAVQSVELAQNTLDFFTKVFDLIMSIIDPFGFFDMFTTKLNAATSAAIDAERYLMTSTMSSIGSTVTSSAEGNRNAMANTIGGATAVIAAAETKSTDAMVAAVEKAGVSSTFEGMMSDYTRATQEAQAAIAANQVESNAISYASMEQQAKSSSEYQQKQAAAQEQDAKYEDDKKAAREKQEAQQAAEDLMKEENHDNIILIKDAMSDLDMSERLDSILEEHRTHTEQIKDLQQQTGEIVKLISTIIEYSMQQDPSFASNISPDERERIMDNGYVSEFKLFR